MGTLTVKENLFFSASLRLPTRMTWAERKRRVEKVLNELGLTDCANTKVPLIEYTHNTHIDNTHMYMYMYM